MSKLCPYCKSEKIGSFNDTVYCCMACHRLLGKSQLIDRTVFDHITQSVETLANELVYWEQNPPNSGWTSNLIRRGGYKIYRTKSEAIAATVEALKKEWKSGKDNDVPANDTDNNVGSMEK